ncbi:MAG: hypothetical protein ACXWZF_06720, partial [Actinomycetota bacterium]
MSARGVRIVVGEGPSTRKGLLRFVLDGEGYDVVAEAATTAELARVMATHRPDVVVLDDGIGAVAVGMINEMSPATNVILVWPGAVMPVGGAARVEPSRVLQDLGPTVERLTGQLSASSAGGGAALLDRAANDPDVLRAMLLGGMATVDEPIIEDREPAPVVILPVTPAIDREGAVLQVPEAEPQDDEGAKAPGAAVAGGVAAAAMLGSAAPAAAAEGTEGATPGGVAARGVGAQSALNRRLGNMALGGAAVASALVLALALGGARIPVDGINGIFASPPSIDSPEPGTSGPPGSDDGQPPGNGGEDGNPGNDQTGGETGGEVFTRTGGNDVPTPTTAPPAPSGPPDVAVEPADIDPGTGGSGDDGGGDDGGGGGGTGSPDDGGGGDDHAGGDAGGSSDGDGGAGGSPAGSGGGGGGGAGGSPAGSGGSGDDGGAGGSPAGSGGGGHHDDGGGDDREDDDHGDGGGDDREDDDHGDGGGDDRE